MQTRLFDHIDLRVRNLAEADKFYGRMLLALGFPVRGVTERCIYYEARRDHPKPEFIELIEKPDHTPDDTRIAFWSETKEAVDAFAAILAGSGAQAVEGPMFCPEYSPTYYAVFFNDPCGNRLEVCCRNVRTQS